MQWAYTNTFEIRDITHLACSAKCCGSAEFKIPAEVITKVFGDDLVCDFCNTKMFKEAPAQNDATHTDNETTLFS